ncbi:Reverse transcriptase domain [Cinara cedri]|uniref:Reverse transcriptase domain n=1 Tax=Cinara cedri TaxID=506608 RepID=A0A5E4N129_9HEMI|nr:Reverse transcriptase domain [Cinara cedri]
MQFGFRELHSIIHQLHRLADTIAYSLEKKLYTSAVFLDVPQALDKVCHPGLLFKPKSSGTKYSSISPILTGIPQGTVASPTLFNLYSADQPTNPNIAHPTTKQPPPVHINSKPIPNFDTAKYLGLTFDKRLTWAKQIHTTKLKLNQRLYSLSILASAHTDLHIPKVAKLYYSKFRNRLQNHPNPHIKKPKNLPEDSKDNFPATL